MCLGETRPYPDRAPELILRLIETCELRESRPETIACHCVAGIEIHDLLVTLQRLGIRTPGQKLVTPSVKSLNVARAGSAF